jgi:hypothetical protein
LAVCKGIQAFSIFSRYLDPIKNSLHKPIEGLEHIWILISSVCTGPIEGVPVGLQKSSGREGEVLLRGVRYLSLTLFIGDREVAAKQQTPSNDIFGEV